MLSHIRSKTQSCTNVITHQLYRKRSKTKSSSSQAMKSGEIKHEKLTNHKDKESSDAPAPLTEAQRKFDEVQKRRVGIVPFK